MSTITISVNGNYARKFAVVQCRVRQGGADASEHCCWCRR